jgi:hypothetical protein
MPFIPSHIIVVIERPSRTSIGTLSLADALRRPTTRGRYRDAWGSRPTSCQSRRSCLQRLFSSKPRMSIPAATLKLVECAARVTSADKLSPDKGTSRHHITSLDIVCLRHAKSRAVVVPCIDLSLPSRAFMKCWLLKSIHCPNCQIGTL